MNKWDYNNLSYVDDDDYDAEQQGDEYFDDASNTQSSSASFPSLRGTLDEAANEEDEFCPLCMEEFDATDKQFLPCRCSYKICLWCWHSLNNLHEGAASLSLTSANQRDRPPLTGKCPGCRRQYEYPNQRLLINAEVLQSSLENKQVRIRAKKEAALKKRALAESQRTQPQRPDESPAACRIIQRSMLYVTGIPPALAQEELLTSQRYFGKFGKIVKIALNRRAMPSNNQRSLSSPSSQSQSSPQQTYSAHITYKRQSDCATAMQCTNGTLLQGSLIKSMNGTTKYCPVFLRAQQCPLNKCGYMHEWARREDLITRDQLNLLEMKSDSDRPAQFPIQTTAAEALAAYRLHLTVLQRSTSDENNATTTNTGTDTTTETKPAPGLASTTATPAAPASAWAARAAQPQQLRPYVSILAQSQTAIQSTTQPSMTPPQSSPSVKPSTWPALAANTAKSQTSNTEQQGVPPLDLTTNANTSASAGVTTALLARSPTASAAKSQKSEQNRSASSSRASMRIATTASSQAASRGSSPSLESNRQPVDTSPSSDSNSLASTSSMTSITLDESVGAVMPMPASAETEDNKVKQNQASEEPLTVGEKSVPVSAKPPPGFEARVVSAAAPPLPPRRVDPRYDYDFLFHSHSDFAPFFIESARDDPYWSWLCEHPCVQQHPLMRQPGQPVKAEWNCSVFSWARKSEQ